MKTYDKHIEELSYEIADDILRKEKDPNWEITFHQYDVAKSLSSIYYREFESVSEDLDNSVRNNLKKIRSRKSYISY